MSVAVRQRWNESGQISEMCEDYKGGSDVWTRMDTFWAATQFTLGKHGATESGSGCSYSVLLVNRAGGKKSNDTSSSPSSRLIRTAPWQVFNFGNVHDIFRNNSRGVEAPACVSLWKLSSLFGDDTHAVVNVGGLQSEESRRVRGTVTLKKVLKENFLHFVVVASSLGFRLRPHNRPWTLSRRQNGTDKQACVPARFTGRREYMYRGFEMEKELLPGLVAPSLQRSGTRNTGHCMCTLVGFVRRLVGSCLDERAGKGTVQQLSKLCLFSKLMLEMVDSVVLAACRVLPGGASLMTFVQSQSWTPSALLTRPKGHCLHSLWDTALTGFHGRIGSRATAWSEIWSSQTARPPGSEFSPCTPHVGCARAITSWSRVTVPGPWLHEPKSLMVFKVLIVWNRLNIQFLHCLTLLIVVFCTVFVKSISPIQENSM